MKNPIHVTGTATVGPAPAVAGPLAVRDPQRQEREHIATMAKLTAVQQWSGQLTEYEKKALMYAHQLYGLDYAQGHIEILGGRMYVTDKGMIRVAKRAEREEHVYRTFTCYEHLPLQELDPPDACRAKCEVGTRTLVFGTGGLVVERVDASFEGYGYASPLDVTKMVREKGQHAIEAMARKRARRAAMATAYDIPWVPPDDGAVFGEEGVVPVERAATAAQPAAASPPTPVGSAPPDAAPPSSPPPAPIFEEDEPPPEDVAPPQAAPPVAAASSPAAAQATPNAQARYFVTGPDGARREAPPPAPRDDPLITPQQRQRLWACCREWLREAGIAPAEIEALVRRYVQQLSGKTSTKDLTQGDFEKLVGTDGAKAQLLALLAR